jgi:hypothetical protein
MNIHDGVKAWHGMISWRHAYINDHKRTNKAVGVRYAEEKDRHLHSEGM